MKNDQNQPPDWPFHVDQMKTIIEPPELLRKLVFWLANPDKVWADGDEQNREHVFLSDLLWSCITGKRTILKVLKFLHLVKSSKYFIFIYYIELV